MPTQLTYLDGNAVGEAVHARVILVVFRHVWCRECCYRLHSSLVPPRGEETKGEWRLRQVGGNTLRDIVVMEPTGPIFRAIDLLSDPRSTPITLPSPRTSTRHGQAECVCL